MTERERFVPQRVGQVTADLDAIGWDDPTDRARFTALCRLVAALFHMEYHEREQALTDAWYAMEGVDPASASGRAPVDASGITGELLELLASANFNPVSIDELDRAMEKESLVPLRLEVDLDDYDDLIIQRRGSRSETVEVPRWRGLRSEQRAITVEERVVVLTRVKPRTWFAQHGDDASEHGLTPGLLSLKLFQDVPRADIEMLLPSTRVRFRTIDTLLVGVPAVASGIVVLATKLLPTLGLIALLISAWLGLRSETPELDQTALVLLFGGAVTLGGFLFRQWSKLKNRRVEYLKTLSENLYFRTVADGPGVIHTLLAAAEEQEVLEVLLAYRLLLAAPEGLSADELDRRVESWLADSCGRDIDFEIVDALAKLERLELLEDGDDRLTAVSLDRALALLDQRWDDLFHPDLDTRVTSPLGER